MAVSGRKRQGNPDRFSSATLNSIVLQMQSLLPFHIYDACWNRLADDFGVLAYNAHTIAGEAIGLLVEAGMFTVEQVQESLDRLAQAGEFLLWSERRGGISTRWAVLPNWGDEQYIPGPTPSRNPAPPARILSKCSLKTRELFAKHRSPQVRKDCEEITQSLRKSSGSVTQFLRSHARARASSLPPDIDEGCNVNGEGGDGGVGEGPQLAAAPEEFRACLELLYAVPGYPADVPADVALLERAQRCFPAIRLDDVVGAWVTRRGDEPLAPNARPRQQLWNWFRMEAKWDEERRQRGDRGTDDRSRGSNLLTRGQAAGAAASWKRPRT